MESDQPCDPIAELAAGALRAAEEVAWPLFEAAWGRLERFIRLRLLAGAISRDLLEDCGQNVLARVWLFRTRYRGEGEPEFWGWLRRICDNERRRIQLQNRRRTVPLPDETAAPRDPPLAVHDPAESNVSLSEEMAGLRECLEKLDDAHRLVIEIIYLEPALTERAAAEVLGCSAAHVHVLKTRGLRLLEACLRRKGVS